MTPSANMPDVWMRIVRAESRWCSNEFELVPGRSGDELEVDG